MEQLYKIFPALHSLWLVFFLILAHSSQAQVEVVESLRQELSTATTDSARLRIHLALSKQFQYLPPQDVQEQALAAIQLAEKLNQPKEKGEATYQLGVGYYLNSQVPEAKAALESVLESEVFSETPRAMADLNNLLGAILSSMGNIREALDHYAQALEITIENKDTTGQVSALANLAEINTYHGDTLKGLQYYRQALHMATAIGDTTDMAVIYNNLSTTTNNPDSILFYAGKALELFTQLGYIDGVAHSSNRYGSGLTEKGQYQAALPYIRKSFQIWEDNNFLPGLNSVYTNLGNIYAFLGDLDSMNYYYNLALSTGDSLADHQTLKETFENMAHTYERIGQPDAALLYYKKTMAMKDSLFSQDKAEQLAVADKRFETQLKEQQLLEQELTITRQQSRQKNILIGGVILLLTLLAWLQFIRNRQKLQRKDADLALQLEKAEAEKLRDLDRIKSNFFANISHEFRTPLTLIQTPLSQALSEAGGEERVILSRSYARSMSRNTHRLLNLVNQLLDLAKLEDGSMILRVSNDDIAHFIRSIGYGFESMALRKQMNYHVSVGSESVAAWFDKEKLEHILSNLLSNAFKFTPSEGRITLEARFLESGMARIVVRDNGIGIPTDQLPHIFDRFYSISTASSDTIGSGIGLALTKELVSLHHGEIGVESQLDRGTTFTLSIPFKKESFSPEEISQSPQKSSSLTTRYLQNVVVSETEVPNSGSTPVQPDDQRPLVLIVEDNEDLRIYIQDQLMQDFQVIPTINGREGYQEAIEQIPDLIITDVMMPEMNGTELCRQIRANEKTSHIPIIMLTAKADRDGKLEGLETGADDYLTKPFDTLELLIRARNLIEQRRLLRERFAGEVRFQPSEIATTSVDEIFLNKVAEAIETHMEEEAFSVVELSQAVAMSRSQLHRKLKALSGKSPNEIIRNMRLLRAKSLLEQKAGNASEVAFMVGFSSLAYFSKCFKDQFGMTPSEVG